MALHGLSSAERKALGQGEPMASLAPGLRHEIFRLGVVRRYLHADWIAAAGQSATDWFCCVKGFVRVSSGNGRTGGAVLAYLPPGSWFGDEALIGEAGQLHDFVAHGDTTVIALASGVFRRLLREEPGFSAAVLRLQVNRAQALIAAIEDWRGLQLRPRIAKQLASLAGIGDARASSRSGQFGGPLYVGLTQGELARVVGASRQRVNLVLKAMERDRLIESGHDGVHIRDLEGLKSVWLGARHAAP